MSINRFASQKFAGSAFKSALKRLFWNTFRRPMRERLGPDTYVMPPFFCNAPGRTSVGARGTIGSNARFNLLLDYLDQRFEPALRIGDDAYIGSNCEIVCVDQVMIGSGCTLSDGVYINDSSHGFDPRAGLLMDRPLTSKGAVIIGDGCFIGRAAMILPGVVLGEHCVVGAGSVVTRSAPAYSMLGGNPARVVARFDLNAGAWIRTS
jgi:acetyltransferase-like isoleucine patch superfamily enzyme